MTTEVERKWLLDGVPPDIPLGSGTPMRQGYVARDGDVEVRIRITADAAELTLKAGRGLSRTEVAVAIALDEAEALWPHTEGRRIEKRRHEVTVTDGTAEIDLYGGRLDGLTTVEVEFPTEADAAAFEPPTWFGREVTGDDRWSNAALAADGRPE